MREFQEKKKNRRRLYSWWSIALLALVVVLFARGSWLVYQKDRQSKIDLAETNRQLAILQARHDLLTTQISSLQTEQGKEDEIKQDFQVTKDGERVAVIVDDDYIPTSTATSTPPGLLERFWGFLGHLF